MKQKLKLKPSLITLYRCPNCDGYLEGGNRNIWNKKLIKEWEN